MLQQCNILNLHIFTIRKYSLLSSRNTRFEIYFGINFVSDFYIFFRLSIPPTWRRGFSSVQWRRGTSQNSMYTIAV